MQYFERKDGSERFCIYDAISKGNTVFNVNGEVFIISPNDLEAVVASLNSRLLEVRTKYILNEECVGYSIIDNLTKLRVAWLECLSFDEATRIVNLLNED